MSNTQTLEQRQREREQQEERMYPASEGWMKKYRVQVSGYGIKKRCRKADRFFEEAKGFADVLAITPEIRELARNYLAGFKRVDEATVTVTQVYAKVDNGILSTSFSVFSPKIEEKLV